MKITHHNAIEKYLSGEITCEQALHVMWPRANEFMERIRAISTLKYSVDDNKKLKSWIHQWLHNPIYDEYNANEVSLCVIKDILYLIPKESKMTKPIRLIK